MPVKKLEKEFEACKKSLDRYGKVIGEPVLKTSIFCFILFE